MYREQSPRNPRTDRTRRNLQTAIALGVLLALVAGPSGWSVRAALQPIAFRGWIQRVERDTGWIEMQTTEYLESAWHSEEREIRFVPPNHDALERLSSGDYVQVVFLGAVEANSVQLIAELGSPTELVASALYGDPQFLSIGSTSLRLLGDYEISYENGTDCSACGAHYCPALKTSLTVYNSSGEAGSCTLEPGQRCMIPHNGNRIFTTFHSGEVICQPVPGPQPVSNFTIDLEVSLTSPFETEHFEIHFDDGAAANWGDDRRLDCAGSINHECTLVDGSNGWPDFVEAVGLAMETVRFVQLETYGFGPDYEPQSGDIPPNSYHDKYQIHIDPNLDGNGVMQPDHFNVIDFGSNASHIAFNEDWLYGEWSDDPWQLHGYCAEEYFHAIQHAILGDDIWESLRTKELWSLEGSATWIAHELLLEEFGEGYKVYNERVWDYLVHTYGPLKIPNAEVEDPPEGEYGRALYWRFLCNNLKEHFGKPGNEHHVSLLRKIFENLAGMEEFPCPATAINDATKTDFDSLYMSFVRGNCFATEWYPSLSLPGDLRIVSIDLSSVETQSFTPGAGQEVGRYACYYIKVTSPADCPVSVSFDGHGDRYFFERFMGGNEVQSAASMSKKDFFHTLPGVSANGTLYIIGRLDDEGDGTFSMTFSRGEEPEPEATSSTMLVIDTSGSMTEDDENEKSKIVAAIEAAADLINMLTSETRNGASHEVAVVAFETDALTVVPLTSNLEDALSRIRTLSTGSSTNMYDGLALANDQLATATGKPIMILLSDGQPNEGHVGSYGSYQDAILAEPVAQAARAGYCIYVVGFGDPSLGNIDEAFLDRIVTAAGCDDTVYTAANAVGLYSAYVEMRYESMGRVLVSKTSDDILQGQTRRTPNIEVPVDQGVFYSTLVWPGSALDLNLTDPRGRGVDHTYPGATIDVYDNMVYAIVEDPIPGTWQASVYGRDVPTGTTQFAFLASVEPATETPREPEELELGMLRFTAAGPVDVALRDPKGRIVSQDVSEIDEVAYVESADQVVITILNRIVGDYEIRVIVEPGADRLDRFDVTVTDGFDTVTLAGRKFIIHAPRDPYIIRSTLEGFADVTDVLDLAPIETAPSSPDVPRGGLLQLPILWIAVGAVVVIGGVGALLWFLRSRYYI